MPAFSTCPPASLSSSFAFTDPFARRPSPERRTSVLLRGKTLDTLVPPFVRGPLASAAKSRPPSFIRTPSPKEYSPTDISSAHSAMDVLEARQPSPLPPLDLPTLPSDMHSLTDRLNRLVVQSNAYVEGLAYRLSCMELQKETLASPATADKLTAFLREHKPFAGLDVERMASFNLPLAVWQEVANQVLAENPDVASGLESVLYWRARAEAEVMGRLQNDRRGSGSSVRSGSNSAGSSDGSQSLLQVPLLNVPVGLLPVPEHRPVLAHARSAHAVLMRQKDNYAATPLERRA